VVVIKRILLIRHGQTDWNMEGRWQGTVDIPLNAEGQMQARVLADHLAEWPITAVYSSDLQRAYETACVLAERKGLTVQQDARLRELNLGAFQGLTHAEISARYPAEMVAMREDYMGFVVPDGESRRAMQGRAIEALNEIVAREPDGDIAIVTHGGTIRVILLKLLSDDPSVARMAIGNTSITLLETDGQTWRLLQETATPHLDHMRRTDVDGL
jgi:2,3-bisphosphoglycerate-dependent phosphoglycerate mutase